MKKLRLHRFISSTRAEGPGLRACLWVQGCPIRCPNCFLSQTWDSAGGKEVNVSVLATNILAGPPVEGITFLGGEPFAQADALAELAFILRAHGFSILTFTGYTLEDIIRADQEDWSRLLSVTDLLIDGPYQHKEQDFSRPWVGSSNQRYHFMTERYLYLKSTIHTLPNRLEVTIGADGIVQINGMASRAHITAIIEAVSKQSQSEN